MLTIFIANNIKE